MVFNDFLSKAKNYLNLACPMQEEEVFDIERNILSAHGKTDTMNFH